MIDADALVVWPKKPHAEGCTGALYRSRETVWLDATGRRNPNGSTVAHKYTCWDGCEALVYVPEATLRRIAADAIGEHEEDYR